MALNTLESVVDGGLLPPSDCPSDIIPSTSHPPSTSHTPLSLSLPLWHFSPTGEGKRSQRETTTHTHARAPTHTHRTASSQGGLLPLNAQAYRKGRGGTDGGGREFPPPAKQVDKKRTRRKQEEERKREKESPVFGMEPVRRELGERERRVISLLGEDSGRDQRAYPTRRAHALAENR